VCSDILGDEIISATWTSRSPAPTKGITSLQIGHQDRRHYRGDHKVALGQAKEGRIHILGEMAKALTNARAELGEYAPRIETFRSQPTRSAK